MRPILILCFLVLTACSNQSDEATSETSRHTAQKETDSLVVELDAAVAKAPSVYVLLLGALNDGERLTRSTALAADIDDSGLKQLEERDRAGYGELLFNPSTANLQRYLAERAELLDLLRPELTEIDTDFWRACRRHPVLCRRSDLDFDPGVLTERQRHCDLLYEQIVEKEEQCRLLGDQSLPCDELVVLLRNYFGSGCSLVDGGFASRFIALNAAQLEAETDAAIESAPSVYALLMDVRKREISEGTAALIQYSDVFDSRRLQTFERQQAEALRRPNTVTIQGLLRDRRDAIGPLRPPVQSTVDSRDHIACAKVPILCDEELRERINNAQDCASLEAQLALLFGECGSDTGASDCTRKLVMLSEIYDNSFCRDSG